MSFDRPQENADSPIRRRVDFGSHPIADSSIDIRREPVTRSEELRPAFEARHAVVVVSVVENLRVQKMGRDRRLALEDRIGQAPTRIRDVRLNVARVRGRAPRELATYLEQQQGTDYGSEIVKSVELYESELSPARSRYIILAKANLGE